MTDETVIVGEAEAGDQAAIDAINEAAFGGRVEADLVVALRQSGDAVLELVAETGNAIVGHVLLSRLQAPRHCLALAPVSVLPQHQRMGIGSMLIRRAVAWAEAHGWAAIFLLGDPAYYRRFGFCVKKADRFETDYPKAFFMALDLQPQAFAGLAGRVIYPAAFEEVS